MNTITINAKKHNYDVILHEKLGTLLDKYLVKEQKYFVVIDNKLTKKYKEMILAAAPKSIIYEVEGGENAKSLKQYEIVTEEMLKNNISKKDMLIAFGGGTITDLVGYLASTYKRGINFINIPTTTLAMIDASVGGKNALNIGDIKNAVGTIYPPQKVLVGFDVLETLDKKQFNNGLFEAIKMGLILDSNLFEQFANGSYENNINSIIEKCILLKKKIVEQDEDDKGIRKILNFGHTIGHAIELQTGLLHGEAIANGMLVVSYKESFSNELKTILSSMSCPIINSLNGDTLVSILKNDKKVNSKTIDLVVVKEPGKAEIVPTDFETIERMVNDYVI